MKNVLYILALLLTLVNCKKNQIPVDAPLDPVDTIQTHIDTSNMELGKCFVLKNSEQWNVPFKCTYYRKDTTFRIDADILHSNLLEEHFMLRDIPCRPGRYSIEFFPSLAGLNNGLPESFFSYTYELDQPVGSFLIDTTRTDHFVEVTQYDSLTKTVKGQFQVFLGKKPSSVPFSGVPDSIFMTEGKFHLKIEDP